MDYFGQIDFKIGLCIKVYANIGHNKCEDHISDN